MPVLNSGHTKQMEILVLMRASKTVFKSLSSDAGGRTDRGDWSCRCSHVSVQTHMYTKHPWPFLLNDLLRTFWHQVQIAFCGLVRRDSWEVHRARARLRAVNLLYVNAGVQFLSVPC